jgi:SAM-dependent methyltransferase
MLHSARCRAEIKRQLPLAGASGWCWKNNGAVMSAVDPLGYDELPYPCSPYPQSQPEHLATLACLMGLEYPPLVGARVLEIGCGDGANLLPLTLTMPGADLHGIDLSPRQIETGLTTMRALQLDRVQLAVRDLRDLNDADGAFDYIIAHGVYSWTPPDVRDALLTLFQRRLSPTGIGFISYNAMPGWSNRLAIREWLLAAIGSGRTGTSRVAEARRLMRQLCELLQGDASTRDIAVRSELTRLLEWSDGYLRHDLLEDHNQPVTFRQFNEHLTQHGVQFLAEADFPTMVGHGLPSHLAQAVQTQSSGALAREQLFDVLTNREFRQSLVIHADRKVPRSIDARVIEHMYVGSPLKPVTAARGTTTFRAANGFAIEVIEPFVVPALNQLAEAWPSWIAFDALADAGRRALRAHPQSLADERRNSLRSELAMLLLGCFAERAVELHVAAPPFTVVPNERPSTSLLARRQVLTSPMVTNLRHDLVRLSEAARELLPLLDGNRGIADLERTTEDFECAMREIARSALLTR